ncbi:MAG: NAD-dependent dehydratase, partial [Acidobacteria bacterium]|nr:NAD-dependent dehydratase [Acidobacteriota bacterium]
IYNVGEREASTEAEWARQIGAAAGWRGEVIAVQRESLPAHLRADYDWSCHLYVDTSRIREELGYTETVSPEEAMRRTVAWQRANPPAEIDPGQFDYEAEDAALKIKDEG